MSLAELVAAGPSPRIARTDANVVTLDIERLPGRAIHKHRGLTIEGDFWDLNSWKHTIGYRLPADSVVEWPRSICAAWKWYTGKRIEFAAEWLTDNEAMHRALWDVYDQADIVVGHNIQGFDTKKLATTWLEMGLPKPSPWKSVDTLRVARTELGAESNTLDALCKRLDIPAKTDKYDVATARAACEGNKAAQRKIAGYNRGDILASEALYDRLRGWMPNHPHLGQLDESEERCNQCGGGDLHKAGTYLAVQIRYVAYRCKSCGANLRGSAHSRAANVRGAR